MLRLHPADLRAIVEAILAAPNRSEGLAGPWADKIIAKAKEAHPDPAPNARERWRLGNQPSDPAAGSDFKVQPMADPAPGTFTLNITDPDTGEAHTISGSGEAMVALNKLHVFMKSEAAREWSDKGAWHERERIVALLNADFVVHTPGDLNPWDSASLLARFENKG